jgi:cytochrome c oxidase subunit 2
MSLIKNLIFFITSMSVFNIAHAGWLDLNMTKGVTDISQEVFGLHMLILWICVVIGVIVFGAMFWSILMHRKSRGVKPATFHESTSLEFLWTIVPFVILIGMAVPATKTLIKMYDHGDSEIHIKITGYQWLWQYEYLNTNVSFYSKLSTPYDEIYNKNTKNINYLQEVDKHLIVPVNKKIRFLLTSNDVLHAWWVPDLALKKDAIPGYINEMSVVINEPGIYRGRCAELCGRHHGFMPIVIEAVEEKEYEEWLANADRVKSSDVAKINK